MPRWSKWALGVVAVIAFDLLFCGGVFTISPIVAVPVMLAIGWVFYLVRTLPEVTVSPAGAATAVVTLGLLVVGVHRFGLWWARNAGGSPASAGGPRPSPWPIRRSVSAVALVVVMFAAGLCGVAVAHQTAWLLTSPDPLTENLWNEASRRSVSKNRLKEIGLAFHDHHDAHAAFPAGGTFDDAGHGMHSWATALLPYLERRPTYDAIEFALPWDNVANEPAMHTRIETFLMPSVSPDYVGDGPFAPAAIHYAGNAHVLAADRGTAFRDIPDGSSNTILAGEAAGDFKTWGDPTNLRDPTLGVNRVPDGFGGPRRSAGTQFLLLDGSVRFVSDDIDPAILRAIATPSGSEPVGDF